jgi:hypothetical protein
VVDFGQKLIRIGQTGRRSPPAAREEEEDRWKIRL